MIDIDGHGPIYVRLYNTPDSINEEMQLQEGVKLGGLEDGGRRSLDNNSISEERIEERDYRGSLPFSGEWDRGHQLSAWSVISLIQVVFSCACMTHPTSDRYRSWKASTGVVIRIGPFMAH